MLCIHDSSFRKNNLLVDQLKGLSSLEVSSNIICSIVDSVLEVHCQTLSCIIDILPVIAWILETERTHKRTNSECCDIGCVAGGVVGYVCSDGCHGVGTALLFEGGGDGGESVSCGDSPVLALFVFPTGVHNLSDCKPNICNRSLAVGGGGPLASACFSALRLGCSCCVFVLQPVDFPMSGQAEKEQW